MKSYATILIIWMALPFSCQAQGKGKLQEFGKYYKIGAYDVYVPFKDRPHISPHREYKLGKLVSYQYAYPQKNDDANYLYGVEICELKSSPFLDNNFKIGLLVDSGKEMFQMVQGAKLIAEEERTFKGANSVFQKIEITIPDIGAAYVSSLYFLHKGLIIRLFAFTPIEKDGNRRIKSFFDSVKFD